VRLEGQQFWIDASSPAAADSMDITHLFNKSIAFNKGLRSFVETSDTLTPTWKYCQQLSLRDNVDRLNQPIRML
jgi:hypothetical protein